MHRLLLWISSLGAVAPVVFIAAYVAACVLFIPGSIMTIGAGVLFGVVRKFPRTWHLWGAGVTVIFLAFVQLIAPVYIFACFWAWLGEATLHRYRAASAGGSQ